jgi:hypothetical protein
LHSCKPMPRLQPVSRIVGIGFPNRQVKKKGAHWAPFRIGGEGGI